MRATVSRRSRRGVPGAEALSRRKGRTCLQHGLAILRCLVQFREFGRGHRAADAAEGVDEMKTEPVVLAPEEVEEHGQAARIPQPPQARDGCGADVLILVAQVIDEMGGGAFVRDLAQEGDEGQLDVQIALHEVVVNVGKDRLAQLDEGLDGGGLADAPVGVSQEQIQQGQGLIGRQVGEGQGGLAPGLHVGRGSLAGQVLAHSRPPFRFLPEDSGRLGESLLCFGKGRFHPASPLLPLSEVMLHDSAKVLAGPGPAVLQIAAALGRLIGEEAEEVRNVPDLYHPVRIVDQKVREDAARQP
jgi:hypothetical protein